MRTAALLVAGLFLVVACGSDDPLADPTDDPTADTAVDAPVTSPEVPVTDPTATDAPSATDPPTTPERLAAQAVDDLTSRLALDPADVTVASVEEVTWRTTAIGCPQKDFQYAQVLTPGVRIVLEHDGRTYDYHAGGGREPFHCVDPEPPVGE